MRKYYWKNSIFSDLNWDNLPLTYSKYEADSQFSFSVYKKEDSTQM